MALRARKENRAAKHEAAQRKVLDREQREPFGLASDSRVRSVPSSALGAEVTVALGTKCCGTKRFATRIKGAEARTT